MLEQEFRVNGREGCCRGICCVLLYAHLVWNCVEWFLVSRLVLDVVFQRFFVIPDAFNTPVTCSIISCSSRLLWYRLVAVVARREWLVESFDTCISCLTQSRDSCSKFVTSNGFDWNTTFQFLVCPVALGRTRLQE